jgi:hypothetical protein
MESPLYLLDVSAGTVEVVEGSHDEQARALDEFQSRSDVIETGNRLYTQTSTGA